MSSAPPRLPPFADALLSIERRDAALRWLLDQGYPAWRSTRLWARWCATTGTRGTAAEYRHLELAEHPEEG